MFKKGKATDPNNYRFIMKLVVAEKLMLVIIGNRLHMLIESFGAEYESQCGFRARVGCVDAIFALRLSLRKRKEHGYHTWVAFLDLVKAFDTISRELLWEILTKLGCPQRFVDRIKALHDTVLIQLKRGDVSVTAEAYSGVRQGDIIGPSLFNLYMFAALLSFKCRKHTPDCLFQTNVTSLEQRLHGIPSKLSGTAIAVNEILYADETALLSNSKEELTSDLMLIRQVFTEFCMTMHEGGPGGNPSKTE
jgi:hypothetical protein